MSSTWSAALTLAADHLDGLVDTEARRRRDLLRECPHPLALAQRLDRTIVSTPAMELVSRTWADTLAQRDGRATISVPPQSGKSVMARWAIFWALLDDPDRRCVFASYGMALARTSGRIIRSLVETHGGPYGLHLDQSHHDAADWQLAGHDGGVLSAGVGSSLTGRPSDLMCLDDLLSGQEAASSPVVKAKVADWWETVARTRMAPGTPAVAIGTRWAEDDILSRFIAEGWTRVNIPALADGDTEDSLAREPGEYLESTRGTTVEDWETIRRESGERTWAALFQGRPAPVEGGIFKRAWFDNARVPVAPELEQVVIGVDPAETGTGDAAGVLVAGMAADLQLYVLADLSDQLSQAQWARRICVGALRHGAQRVIAERTLGMNSAIPDAWSILVRQAAALEAAGRLNGHGSGDRVADAARLLREAGDAQHASEQALREVAELSHLVGSLPSTGPRVVIVTPRGHKRIRAEAVTSLFENGRAHIVGTLPVLEYEAVTWVEGMPSPNRVDVLALVMSQLEQTRHAASVGVPKGAGRVPLSSVGGSRRRSEQVPMVSAARGGARR